MAGSDGERFAIRSSFLSWRSWSLEVRAWVVEVRKGRDWGWGREREGG